MCSESNYSDFGDNAGTEKQCEQRTDYRGDQRVPKILRQRDQLGYAREVFERNAFFDDVTQNKAHARIRWLKRRQ